MLQVNGELAGVKENVALTAQERDRAQENLTSLQFEVANTKTKFEKTGEVKNITYPGGRGRLVSSDKDVILVEIGQIVILVENHHQPPN